MRKLCKEALLDSKGFTFETPNGYIQQRPEVAIANKAQERMLAAAKELGLTPASRSRMNKQKMVLIDENYDDELEDMIAHDA